METRSGFSGVYPMLYALFDAEGDLDRAAMRRQTDLVVAQGVHGVGVLGLATEVNKLSTVERRTLLEWAAEDLDGRRPLAVTVAEASVGGQIAFVRAAAEAGAAWVILQPPPVRGLPEIEYLRFFGAVADAAPVPVAIQVAPEYLGTDLSAAGLKSLNANHPNVSLLKLEATALGIARTVDTTDGAFDIFNGQAGVQMTDSLRAGCVGVIPGAESCDVTTRIFDAFTSGSADGETEADRLYAEVLPLLVFLMHSRDTFLVYGKPLFAKRSGFNGWDRVRPPFAERQAIGMEIVERYAAKLGRF